MQILLWILTFIWSFSISFLFHLDLGYAVEGSVLQLQDQIQQQCVESLSQFPGQFDTLKLKEACLKVNWNSTCRSVKGIPIFHLEKKSTKEWAKRILVFSLIHGDEWPAGTVGRYWFLRLQNLDPRNHWRVIPVLNPDGVKLRTRTNANRIDLNRNFPTKDWSKTSLHHWQREQKANPRRFPGTQAASEPEVQCALRHIEEFKPDFIVSIHTPLHVIDFDGPRIQPPSQLHYLPWRNLGHFPGSLGRYMWFERKTPVLTMELNEDLPSTNKPLDELQDVVGWIASLESDFENTRSDKRSKPSSEKIKTKLKSSSTVIR